MKNLKGKKVIIGMSGGVDSSVAAALLKEQGMEVIGLFMKNWDEKDEFGVCQASKEYEDVVKVCEKLEIPYYTVDFVKEYQEQVFQHFIEEYKKGYTPNPDILCNREIKFKVFFDKAMELGADYLATGHYCQVEEQSGQFVLKKGLDPNKDQSYFLSAIDGAVLDRVLFPIGNLNKSEVRDLALKLDLATATKKDSTGVCFIGERNFKEFLANFIKSEKGYFMTPEGDIVGEHHGAYYYTRGQRKGLGIGGPGKPWFVVGKDMHKNIVYVVQGDDHPALYHRYLKAKEVSWITKALAPREFPFRCQAKIRYRQEDQDCEILSYDGEEILIKFDSPQRAITPRQQVVFYHNDICLGGGVIENGMNALQGPFLSFSANA